jgi:galactosylceramidase
LRNPKTGDWSVVIVTGEKRTIQLTVLAGLKIGPVHLWKSTAAAQFIEQPPLCLRNHTVELELEPEAIYTITSTTGQQKGSHGTPPPRKPFPFPFEENLESYHSGDTPRYFSDQKGTFEVYQSPKGGLCLAQIVPAQGILWFANLLKPHTLFGDTNWQDCVIEADVLLAGGDVEIGGRYADRGKLGYRWILTPDGRWQLNWQYTSLASGQIEGFKPAEWHHLRLEMKGDRISGAVDGKALAAVTDASGAKGRAFLASTYNRNLFDNVHVGPIRIPDKTTP